MASASINYVHINYKTDDWLSRCASTLQDLRKIEKLCDLEINVGDRRISAHRVILAAVVPYFHKIICSLSQDSRRTMQIVMKNVDPDVIESLIDFCYSGEIKISNKNVETLLIYADLFEMPVIRLVCTEFMASNLSAANVINLKRIGVSNNLESLVSTTNNYICSNFKEFSESKDFMNLTSNEILEIIERDDLKVLNEQEVYEATMRWIRCDHTQRALVLPEILKRIRLVYLPSQYLVNVVSKESLIRQSLECRDILDDAKDQFISMRREVQPRQYLKEVIYVVCGSNLGTSPLNNSVLKYEDNNWMEVTKLFKPKKFFGGALVNKKFYVIGGRTNNGDFSSSVEIFDIQRNEWFEGKNLIERRRAFGVAKLNGFIYACGGAGVDGKIISSVECFSESQDDRKKVASLNQSRCIFDTVSLNGYIYAIAGSSGGSKILNTCERFCPQQNKWTFVKPLSIPRYGFGVATLNGKIYVCGGCDSSNDLLNSCEVYDPETNCWTSIAPMQNRRGAFPLASCNGKLYAIGGWNGAFVLSVEEYCPEKNAWRFVKSLPDTASGMVAVTTYQ